MFIKRVVSAGTERGKALAHIKGWEDQSIFSSCRNIGGGKAQAGQIEWFAKGLAIVSCAAGADTDLSQPSWADGDGVVECAAPVGIGSGAVIAARRRVAIVTK